MQIRLIAVSLVSTTAVAGIALASGFPAGSAQAGPALASAIRASTARTSTISARAAQPTGLAGSQLNQGVITGVVDGAGGRPLIGACVVATGPAGTAGTMTRVGGRYVLPALHAGGYTLHYSACAAGGGYVDQWSGGATWPQRASVVTVAAGQVKQVSRVTLRSTPTPAPTAQSGGVTFRVSPGAARSAQFPMTASPPTGASATITASTGGIAGRVTGNGRPLKGICVNAYGPGHGEVLTSKTGQFQIGRLHPGRYLVEFVPNFYCGQNTGNWLLQWYRGITSLQEPRHPVLVPVTAAKVTRNINAALRPGSEITGTTRSKAGKALAHVCVFVEGQISRSVGYGFQIASSTNGSYALHSLFKGKYFVEFTPYCGVKGNYAQQWYKDSADQTHARAIEITRAQVVSHIDAALPPGGIVTGVVRAKATNARLGKICVYIRPLRGGSGPFFGTRTAADGSYKLTDLSTGKYLLQFSRYCGNEGNFLPVQRVLSVRAGHTLAVNVYLPPGAIVSGVVTDAHGNPVKGVCVAAYNNRNYNSAVSAADGTYSVNALPTGNYSVQFSGGCGNANSYATLYYHGQVNPASANPVALTSGQTTSGIDAAMPPGGTITGQVTDAAGNPLKRVCVSVVGEPNLSFGFPFNLQFTKNGTYTAKNLNPGLYGVNFGCFFGIQSYASQWFRSQNGTGTADLVSAPGAPSRRASAPPCHAAVSSAAWSRIARTPSSRASA